jgi:hypothetical protein
MSDLPPSRAAFRPLLSPRKEAPMNHVPTGLRPLIPQLVVSDGRALIQFLERAFGATLRDALPGPDGKGIMHAHVTLEGETLFLRAGISKESCGPGATGVTRNAALPRRRRGLARSGFGPTSGRGEAWARRCNASRRNVSWQRDIAPGDAIVSRCRPPISEPGSWRGGRQHGSPPRPEIPQSGPFRPARPARVAR